MNPQDTPENLHAAERLHARAREFRGRFLHSIAVIEHDAIRHITGYFCPYWAGQWLERLNFAVRPWVLVTWRQMCAAGAVEDERVTQAQRVLHASQVVV